jgi:hypothetical protein
MSRIQRLFAEHRWPWNVLTALCLLLGVLLLLRDRPGCPDVVVMHSDLARLDDALRDCCRCATLEDRVVIGDDAEEVVVVTPPEISDEEIIDRVEEAGGQCTGALCISLAWATTDDIDLIVYEPSTRRIYFDDKVSPSGGRLDVDANGPGRRLTSSPVENIHWNNPPTGRYEIVIRTYKLNETSEGLTIPATLRITKNGQSELIGLSVTAKNETTSNRIPLTYP